MESSIKREIFTRSVLGGSDEELPVCAPCERGNRSLEAHGFCRDCNEHLCETCYNSHLLHKLSRKHVLMDKGTMPRVAALPDDMCPKHQDQQLEYFCGNHDKLECGKCVNLHHRTCVDVSYIPDIAGDIGDSKEFQALYGNLTAIEHSLVQNKAAVRTNLADIQAKVKETKTSIHDYRVYLDQQLDKMEKAMCKEVEVLGTNDKELKESVSDECDAMTSNVRSITYSLEVSRESKQMTRLFITMKKSKQLISGWQHRMDDMAVKNKIMQYQFQPDKQLQSVIGPGQKLGHLVMAIDADEADVDVVGTESGAMGANALRRSFDEQCGSIDSEISTISDQLTTEEIKTKGISKQCRSEGPESSSMPGGYLAAETETDVIHDQSKIDEKETSSTPHQLITNAENMSARRISKINVQTQPDSKVCFISGSVRTSDNHLILADYRNRCVKIVDLAERTVVARLKLETEPWGITRLRENIVAVTCPGGGYIQLVRVSNTGNLALDRKVQVGGECNGISYLDSDGGRLVVSFLNSDEVKVIDMSGDTIKDLSKDTLGQSVFRGPEYLAVSDDGRNLIVSNNDTQTVTGMRLDGTVRFVYKDPQLECPRGVAVGNDGEIYMSGWSNNIHVVSSDGRKIKVLLEEKDGIVNPESISYSGDKLYVGNQVNNHVDVFQIRTHKP